MKVLFVDVGQGTCQIILTGKRRAIVIDTGGVPSTALRTLQLCRVETIELLVASHSHADHVGGMGRQRVGRNAASGILAHYQDSIEKIAYVYDSGMKQSAFCQYLVKLIRDKVLNVEQLHHIEASQAQPDLLWQSPDSSTRLAALSPFGGTHILAAESGNPNASSAILELRHHNDRLVFAADSEYSQWRDLYRLRGRRTHCKVLTMPHHGGLMKGTDSDLRWLCDTAIAAEMVVISVGTVNQHRHPRPDVVRAVVASGSHVMCTQITEQCCSHLESLRPGVVGPPAYPCKSSAAADFTKSGKRSRHVACAGTVCARLHSEGITVERRDEHANGVNRLVERGYSPLCRPS